jgi:RNA polymerase sigma-70 factor (ECF subfamily)
MKQTDSLEQLLARSGVGDRAAFKCVYERTSAKLFGVCLRILKDRSEAEEVLQESYVKVWHNAGRYVQAKASPISWLVAIARNQAIDRLRARKPGALDLDEALDLADDGPSPETQAVASDEARRLAACLGQLEPAHAEAVRSAFVEGYTYDELAARMDVPLGTMKSWIRRSLLKLRDCLKR